MAKKGRQEWTVATQAEVAEFFGVAVDTVANWAKRQMPPKARGRYRLDVIAQWLRNEGPWQPRSRLESEDPLLASEGDSPGLERYRLAKAELAELELEERKRSVLPRDKVRDALGRFASIIRRLGERLGKRYGPKATKLFNDAINDCQRLVDTEFGDNPPAQ